MRKINVQLLLVQIIYILLILSIFILSIFQERNTTLEYLRQSSDASVKQAGNSIESILNSVHISTYYLCYSSPIQQILYSDYTQEHAQNKGQKLVLYQNFSNSAKYTINTNENIVDLLLISAGGTVFNYGGQSTELQSLIKPIFENIDKSKAVFTGFMSSTSGNLSPMYYIYLYPVFNSATIGSFSQYLGTCVVLCRANRISEIIDSSQIHNTDLYITYADADGEECILGEKSENDVDTDAERNTFPIYRTDWNLVQVQHLAAIYDGASLGKGVIMQAMLVSVLCIAFLLFYSHNNISKPIAQINHQLQDNASHPEATKMIELSTKNELESIAVMINQMLVQIQESNQRVIESQNNLYESELLQKKLQLQALQSQINPHFLYNTLSCIRGIAIDNDQYLISDISVMLATIFRYSIKGGTYVQLKDELHIIDCYLGIMRIRMDNRFAYTIEVPDHLAQSWTVKMILQPLVENSITHGLEAMEAPGEVHVLAHQYSDTSYIVEIVDNGAGIEESQLRAIQNLLNRGNMPLVQEEGSFGLGLSNINRKIKLMFGNEYGLRVSSTPFQNTTVYVSLPLLNKNP